MKIVEKNESLFRTIFNNIPVLLKISDANADFYFFNDQWIEFTGKKDQKSISNSWINNIHPDDRDICLETTQMALKKKKKFEITYRLKTFNGEYRWILDTGAPYFDPDGTFKGFISSCLDITERKIAEQAINDKKVAEKSLKLKEQFLANMSHEIRTPLNGIIGMTDLLKNTELNKKQQEYVETVRKSSSTLLTIVNDILDISKIEAGKMQLHKTSIAISHTIEKLHSLFLQQATEKNLDFSYHISSNLPKYIKVDESRLLQVLSNLTSNAIKFTDQGSVKIIVKRLSSRIKADRKKYNIPDGSYLIQIEVKDTGIGVAEENFIKLFDSFIQADSTTTKFYQGTGLGLPISKRLCKLMGGDIGVTSKPGAGSNFWFTFQADQAKELVLPQSLQPSVSSTILQGLKEIPKVLLVDDNKINLKVVSEILEKSGCIIDIAFSGMEAIKKVKTGNYGIVLMDIQMPEMDGVASTNKIRKLFQAFPEKRCPVFIAMTAYSMKEDKEKFINAGMDDYIAKPIISETLINKIKYWSEHINREEGRSNKYQSRLINSNRDKKAVSNSIEKLRTTPGYSRKNDSEGTPVIDKNILNQLKDYGGMEMIKKVYEDFEKEARQLLGQCNRSLHYLEKIQPGRDINIILSNLHTLKGNAGTLGIKKVADYAELIEKQLKNKDYDLSRSEKRAYWDIFEGNFLYLNDAFKEYKDKYKGILNI
ncbi:MAG: response regulator [Cytophagales bacterium]|nr:response regulator [Cytophagales bacterium]